MDALNQLAAAYEQAKADPEFQARLDDYLKHYVGRPSPLFHAERLTKLAGGAAIYLKREDLNHTGAAQDQQRDRPGHAGPADGQDAGDRRDRRGPARRRHGHGLRPLRPRMHGLHGRGRHPPAEAERLQHEDAGRDGRAGHDRLADAPRRDQRGDARLDGLVADDALHDRQRGRPAPVPDDRPRLPVGHRPRDAVAVPRPGRPAARCRGGLRRRRLERRGDVLPVHRGRRGRADRRRGGRPRARRPASTPPASPRAGPASCTAASATSSRTTTARPRTSTRSPPGWIIPASAPSTATGRTSAASATRASPTPRPSTPTTPPPGTKGSSRPSSRATRWPRRSRKPGGSGPARSWSSASPAAATRTPTKSPGSAASRSRAHGACSTLCPTETPTHLEAQVSGRVSPLAKGGSEEVIPAKAVRDPREARQRGLTPTPTAY